jgi:endonuclease-3
MPNPKEVLEVFSELNQLYPDSSTELVYDGPFQLLAAVILSAQCTDARVNQTTPALFARYPTPAKMAAAPLKDLEKLVHPCGFYRMKALALKQMAASVENQFGGEIPSTLEELVSLRGVGRKTASVVLNQAFGLPAIAVDTHVKRVAHRLGWTEHSQPEKVEKDLKQLLPPAHWAAINGTLILHGRRLCKSQKPLCGECPLQKHCRFFRESRGSVTIKKPHAKRHRN